MSGESDGEEKRKKSSVYIFTGLIIVALLLIGYSVFWRTPSPTTDEFVQCLNNQGLKLYVLEGCGHCEDQKSLFNETFDQLNVIDCKYQTDICKNSAISAVPAWQFPNGTISTGVHTFELLSQMTGCKHE